MKSDAASTEKEKEQVTCAYSKCNKVMRFGEKGFKMSFDPDLPPLWFCSKNHANLCLYTEIMTYPPIPHRRDGMKRARR